MVVTGENIQVGGAKIDASGQAGGGTVLIGGDTGGGQRHDRGQRRDRRQREPGEQRQSVGLRRGCRDGPQRNRRLRRPCRHRHQARRRHTYLGNGERWHEIYNLNRGRPQPGGGTLT